LYSSPDITGLRWAKHVARKQGKRNAYIILVEKRDGKSHLDDLGIDRGLKRILQKERMRMWTELIWLRIRIKEFI
jgi:hypothetical protein